jgi:hypothetical protein
LGGFGAGDDSTGLVRARSDSNGSEYGDDFLPAPGVFSDVAAFRRSSIVAPFDCFALAERGGTISGDVAETGGVGDGAGRVTTSGARSVGAWGRTVGGGDFRGHKKIKPATSKTTAATGIR